jgi:CheY-like chemotaxis protein
MSTKHEVLCVDDEPEVLEGLRLHLKRYYEVHLATSGAEGLEVLRDHRNIAVIVSDMRMPVMDGAKFLNSARTASRESVRMLLTGYSDIESAIAAVNEGQIFRFISKPCPPEQLLGAFEAAIAQHELIVAERVLLQKTLLGCVESLAKVLSITKPAAFGRALRLRAKVRAAVEYLGLQSQWHIEAAAVLSQLGAVTLSEETLMKLNEGEALDDTDRSDIAASVSASVQMLSDIPRLGPVIEILKHLALEVRGTLPKGHKATPPGTMLLRLVFEWDRLEATGCSQREALAKLANSETQFDRETLEMLKTMPVSPRLNSHPTSVRNLIPGMVLAEDLVCTNGIVILPRGFEIDRGLLDHVRTFAENLEDETVMVFST